MRYGILDIGSNTVVLLIYELCDGKPAVLYNYSEAVHLVRYHKDGMITQEGIDKTCAVLHTYQELLAGHGVDSCYAFITEPIRRISNAKDVLAAFDSEGFNVAPLTGKEEAEYDFYGSRLDCGDVMDGNAFDIGGGSTEFVTFKDGQIVEALSIPVGCVRLSTLPAEPEVSDKYVQEALASHPLLTSVPDHTIIGIGGTVRAAGLMAAQLYGTDHIVPVEYLQTIYDALKKEDPDMIAVRRQVLTPGRQNVFLPGLNMLLSIMRGYHADTLRISDSCVREGYLMDRIGLLNK
ncbi:MAG: hypothetical protein IJ120_07905 [Solobacterium sp.]|nr:hypothetical protein [Solobacterium sp.]